MGFNAGAFAGALGQSALSTYERLGEAGYRQLQKAQMVEDMQDKAALKEAIATASQGKNWAGGQDVSQAINQATSVYGQDADTAKQVQSIIASQTPEQQQQTLRALGGAEGAVTPKTQEGALDLAKVGVYQSPEGKTMATNEGSALSRADIYKGALKKAEETGNIYAIDKLTQMKTQARQSENEDKWDEIVNKNLFTLNNFAHTGNTEDFIKYAKSHGLDARVRKTNDGGQVIEHWENGKLKQSFGSLQAAVDAAQGPLLSKLVEDQGAVLMGSPEKAYAALQQKRANDLKAESNAIEREYKGAGGVIDRAYSSGAKGGGGKGGANSAENQEKLVTMKAETLMKGQPGRFKDLDQAKAWVVNTAMKGYNAETEWAKAELKLLDAQVPDAEIVKRKEAFFSRQGFAPASIVEAARSGINPMTNKPFTEKEQQDFYKRYPNTDIEFGAPAPAGAGNSSAQPAAIPVSPQVSQLQNAVNPKNLKELPLPGRYTSGVAQAVEPQTSEDLRRALY